MFCTSNISVKPIYIPWFKDNLGIEKTPSDTTISRVLQQISNNKFECALLLWSEQLFEDKQIRKRIVIDSKKATTNIMLTRALILEVNQILGTCKFMKNESEIKNIPKLIKKLDKKGYLFSIDAIGTHVEIAN